MFCLLLLLFGYSDDGTKFEQCSGISIASLEMGRVTLTKGNYSLSVAENSHLGANSCYADDLSDLPAYLKHNGRVTRFETLIHFIFEKTHCIFAFSEYNQKIQPPLNFIQNI